MAKSSYGGAQGRAGNTGSVKHGFPRVPHDVVEPKQLRRFLQSTRDGLNEWRWLFDGLSGLTSVQQGRLVSVLVQLSQANTTIANQAVTIIQLQNDLTDLQLLHDADVVDNEADHVVFEDGIEANGLDIVQLQQDYQALLDRVNCLNVAAGNPCP